jgi:hypothetical protein
LLLAMMSWIVPVPDSVASALASSRQLQVTARWRRTCLDLRVPFAVMHPGLRKKIADRDT